VTIDFRFRISDFRFDVARSTASNLQFEICNLKSSDSLHLREVRQERDGAVPGVRPIDQEGLSDQEVAFDIVMVFPKPRVRAGGAVVAQRQELVFFEMELDVTAIVVGKEPARLPKIRIGKDFV
jgi:hypothetical protein